MLIKVCTHKFERVNIISSFKISHNGHKRSSLTKFSMKTDGQTDRLA